MICKGLDIISLVVVVVVVGGGLLRTALDPLEWAGVSPPRSLRVEVFRLALRPKDAKKPPVLETVDELPEGARERTDEGGVPVLLEVAVDRIDCWRC